SGDAVRIAARLARADTGEELWSENFTRNLKDVFAVQTELAQTIVEQLRSRFGGADPGSIAKEKIQAEVQAAEKGGTRNVEAHESYLQGRFYENRHSEKSAREALAAYEQGAGARSGRPEHVNRRGQSRVSTRKHGSSNRTLSQSSRAGPGQRASPDVSRV